MALARSDQWRSPDKGDAQPMAPPFTLHWSQRSGPVPSEGSLGKAEPLRCGVPCGALAWPPMWGLGAAASLWLRRELKSHVWASPQASKNPQ